MTATQAPASPPGSPGTQMTSPSAPTPAGGTSAKPTILRLVHAEFLKIWTTNTWWIMAIIAVVFTALALTLNLFQALDQLDSAKFELQQGMPNFAPTGEDGQPIKVDQGGPSEAELADMKQDWLESHNLGKIVTINAANVFTSGQFFGLLLIVVLGALVVTNEFYHQTATTTFLASPRRTNVIASKLLAGVGLATGFWALSAIISVAVGSIFFAAGDYSTSLTEWPVMRSILMNLLAYTLWMILGIGLGVLLRSQLGATLTAAAFYMLSYPVAFIAFALIRQFIIQGDWIFQWMVIVPGVASQVMISPDRLDLGVTPGPQWWVGALVLVGYAVLAGVIGTLITRKRDIS